MCVQLLSSTTARDGGGYSVSGLFGGYEDGVAMVAVGGMLSCADAGENGQGKDDKAKMLYRDARKDVDESGESERD